VFVVRNYATWQRFLAVYFVAKTMPNAMVVHNGSTQRTM
jgi:hypothetical protein